MYIIFYKETVELRITCLQYFSSASLNFKQGEIISALDRGIWIKKST